MSPPAALGTVVEQDRGSLPFALIHGEALVACAAWGLGDAGVTPVDIGTPWAEIVEAGQPFVLHDSLCPMTPAEFISDCVSLAVERDSVVVGVRPVTDTVKESDPAGTVGATVDRSGLTAICSPLVLPATVVAALEEWPGADFARAVGRLRERFPMELLEAPPAARRVSDPEDLRLLEVLTAGNSG